MYKVTKYLLLFVLHDAGVKHLKHTNPEELRLTDLEGVLGERNEHQQAEFANLCCDCAIQQDNVASREHRNKYHMISQLRTN